MSLCQFPLYIKQDMKDYLAIKQDMKHYLAITHSAITH